MASWFFNRPSDRCDRNELRAANRLKYLSKRRTILWGNYCADKNGMRWERRVFDPMRGFLTSDLKGDQFRQFPPSERRAGNSASVAGHSLIQLDQEQAALVREISWIDPCWHSVARAICLPSEVIPTGRYVYYMGTGRARQLLAVAQSQKGAS